MPNQGKKSRIPTNIAQKINHQDQPQNITCKWKKMLTVYSTTVFRKNCKKHHTKESTHNATHSNNGAKHKKNQVSLTKYKLPILITSLEAQCHFWQPRSPRYTAIKNLHFL